MGEGIKRSFMFSFIFSLYSQQRNLLKKGKEENELCCLQSECVQVSVDLGHDKLKIGSMIQEIRHGHLGRRRVLTQNNSSPKERKWNRNIKK